MRAARLRLCRLPKFLALLLRQQRRKLQRGPLRRSLRLEP